LKTILVLGAGKSATVLIEDLQEACLQNNWHMLIADASLSLAESKIQSPSVARAVALNAQNAIERRSLIRESDLVISLLPPALHILVAKDCLEEGKHLLTASYLDEEVKQLSQQISEKNLLFLYEMGLDPGIDHMSAMQLIEQIKSAGGTIKSFISHCGGLIAPESDNNPWHYKISWNPRNVVLAGKAGAVYLEDGKQIQKKYAEIFKNNSTVQIENLPSLSWYPNRDSVSYISLYQLEESSTFIRTTLRYTDFCKGWQHIVNLGLTDELDEELIKQCSTIKDWWQKKLSLIENRELSFSMYLELYAKEEEHKTLAEQFSFLAFDSEKAIPNGVKCSADLLQKILEEKLVLSKDDHDLIVMIHELVVSYNGNEKKIKSSLLVKGTDTLHTAMAKTVGLPLSIAAQLILSDEISIRGLRVPVVKEIYEPVLNKLKEKGIVFEEKEED
jgi:saccharopine dehydrogenase (NADP+, L-glutamate forming)